MVSSRPMNKLSEVCHVAKHALGDNHRFVAGSDRLVGGIGFAGISGVLTLAMFNCYPPRAGMTRG